LTDRPERMWIPCQRARRASCVLRLAAASAVVAFYLPQMACGSPQRSPTAAVSPKASNSALSPRAASAAFSTVSPVSEQPCAQQQDSDAAVREFAQRMQDLERDCTERFAEGPCEAQQFVLVASRYLNCFAQRRDPHRFEGRIDALPRLSEPSLSPGSLSERMAAACVERCTTARNIGQAQARGEAAELCAKNPDKGRKFCRETSQRAASSARTAFLESCISECDESRRQHEAEVARDLRRPRTRAQSAVCFQSCMRKCTGGRIVPALDGTFKRDPDDWCGTCEVSCEGECAVVTR